MATRVEVRLSGMMTFSVTVDALSLQDAIDKAKSELTDSGVTVIRMLDIHANRPEEEDAETKE